MFNSKNDDVAAFYNKFLGSGEGSVTILNAADPRPEKIEELRKFRDRGLVRKLVPGLYVLAEPEDDGDWGPCDGTPRIPMPMPHLIAAAFCRARAWKMAVTENLACYLLGMDERPTARTLGRFPYNQFKPLSLGDVHVHFEPGRPELFDGMTPVGQALTLAIPRDVSIEGLRDLAEIAAHGVLSLKFLLDMLRQDHSARVLGERERIAAEIILEMAPHRSGRVLRRSPLNFISPPQAPAVENWMVGTQFGNECLFADAVYGHPYLTDGGDDFRSSPLIWLDEKLGWAKTQNRWYRLGRRRQGCPVGS